MHRLHAGRGVSGPRRLATTFHDLLPQQFPVRLFLRDEESGEMLWQHVVEQPGQIRVPSFAPRRVKAILAYGDGVIEVVNSAGDKTTGRWK